MTKDTLLVNAVKEGLDNVDVIAHYPSERQDTIVISQGDLEKVKVYGEKGLLGLNTPDNLILIDNKLQEPTFLTSVFLHELTHYADNVKGNLNYYPTWLGEGLAIYSEIKYQEKKFSSSKGQIPGLNYSYQAKPTKRELMQIYAISPEDYIYSLALNSSDFELKYNLTDTSQYHMYSLLIQSYIRQFGETGLYDAAQRGLKRIRTQEQRGTKYIQTEYDFWFEEAFLQNPQGTISRTQLYMPEKELYDKDQTSFFTKLAGMYYEHEITGSPFVQDGSSHDKIKNMKEDTKTGETEEKSSWFPFIVGLLLLSLLYGIYRFSQKRHTRLKRH